MRTNGLSIREFNILSKGKKLTYLWDECTFIMARVEGNYNVHLYGCMNFYTEVWYKHGINRIQKIGSFKSVRYLTPYLDRIHLVDYWK